MKLESLSLSLSLLPILSIYVLVWCYSKILKNLKGGFVLCFLALVAIEGVEELGFATGSVRVFLLSWPMGVNLKTVFVF